MRIIMTYHLRKLSYKKVTLYLYDIVSKNIIRTHVTEHVYDNMYDSNGLLVEVTNSYLSPVIQDNSQPSTNQMDKKLSYKEKFYYHNTLLIKKEHINCNKTIPVHISTYKYDDHNKILEEQVYLDNEVLSHYISYWICVNILDTKSLTF